LDTWDHHVYLQHYPDELGKADIWQAPILPVFDFKAGGTVDSTDMCIIVDHWGSDESLFDIGPMQWSYCIVDIQDLIVLTKHLFKDSPFFEPIE
jgi:hypothetical protein